MKRDDDVPRRLGSGMIWAGWLLLLGLLTLFFNQKLELGENPNPEPESRITAEGDREVRLQRNRNGHYVASGYINDVPVEFLLDTGASDVSVPEHLARRLRLEKGVQQQYSTANGTAVAWRTVIDRIRLGSIERRNVLASIHPGIPDDTILLGMSFLKHLEFSQQGEQLILRQAAEDR